MFNQSKEVIVSAVCRIKKFVVFVSVFYFIICSTVVPSQALTRYVLESFSVEVQLKDGNEDLQTYKVKRDTLSNVLDELNIELNEEDKINQNLDEVVEDKDIIEITRIETTLENEDTAIPYKTVKKGNSGWTTTPVQQGRNGVLRKTYKVTYENEEEVSKEFVSSVVVKEAQNKILKKGTSIKKGTTFQGRLTTYGGDCKGCGGRASCGLKLSGKTGVNGTKSPYLTYKGKKYYCLAADRSIPFGTIIKITNHNLKTSKTIYGIVVDRGGAIKKNKIDIFKGSEKKKGKQYIKGGTSYNTKYEIVSVGSGKANFWKK